MSKHTSFGLAHHLPLTDSQSEDTDYKTVYLPATTAAAAFVFVDARPADFLLSSSTVVWRVLSGKICIKFRNLFPRVAIAAARLFRNQPAQAGITSMEFYSFIDSQTMAVPITSAISLPFSRHETVGAVQCMR